MKNQRKIVELKTTISEIKKKFTAEINSKMKVIDEWKSGFGDKNDQI